MSTSTEITLNAEQMEILTANFFDFFAKLLPELCRSIAPKLIETCKSQILPNLKRELLAAANDVLSESK